jgi:transcriptional regulator with PAS, ATPase and Fis domain
VPEGKEEEFQQLFQRALDGETFRDVHVQRRSKDGRLLEVNFASAAMLDHDGTVRGIAYALTDITESEKLRKRFKDQHEQLDIALNNMSQGITMFDAEQHLVVCNNLYAKMFGLAADQVKPGTTLGQILAYRQANGCYDMSGRLERSSSFESVRSGDTAACRRSHHPGVMPQDGQRRPRHHAPGHHGERAAERQDRAAAPAAEGA